MKLWLQPAIFLIFQVYVTSFEKNITDFILSRYSPYVRPVIDPNDPVMVEVGIELINIESVNEREQHITNKIWLRMKWINELISWEPSKWGNVQKLKIHPDRLWYPDLTLYNDLTDDLSAGTGRCKTHIVVKASGEHRWSCPIILKSSCVMNVEKFPLDNQTCSMKFGSWAFDKSKMDLIVDERPILTSNYVNSSEWHLDAVKKRLRSVKYKCCQNSYVDITFTFSLSRKPLFYILNVTSPCVILMVLILFSFSLPPNSGERISLIITVILAFAIFMQMLSNYLPKNSNSTPALSIFYITIIAESGFSFIATCFSLIIYHKGTEKGAKSPPIWVRKYIIHKIRNTLKTYKEHDELNMEPSNNATEKDYFLISESNNVKKLKCCNGTEQDGICISPDIRYNDNLLQEVKKITSLKKDQKKQDDIEQDWHLFAKFFDRIFFILFLLIYLASSFAILSPVFLKES